MRCRRDSLFPQTGLPLKACLLLRLGEPALAQELWAALQQANEREFSALSGQASSTNPLPAAQVKLPDADPYLDWASEWAWGLFDRAVCAHMRGDDGLALASARLLTTARPRLEAEAVHRGFKRPPSYNSSGNENYQDYLTFLGPLPALLADQECRALKGTPSPPLVEVTRLTNQTARIIALVGELDEVAVRPMGTAGRSRALGIRSRSYEVARGRHPGHRAFVAMPGGRLRQPINSLR